MKKVFLFQFLLASILSNAQTINLNPQLIQKGCGNFTIKSYREENAVAYKGGYSYFTIEVCNKTEKEINPYDMLMLQSSYTEQSKRKATASAFVSGYKKGEMIRANEWRTVYDENYSEWMQNATDLLPKEKDFKWWKFKLKPNDCLTWEIKMPLIDRARYKEIELRIGDDKTSGWAVSIFKLNMKSSEKLNIEQDNWYALDEEDRINRMDVQYIKYDKLKITLRAYVYNLDFMTRKEYNLKNHTLEMFDGSNRLKYSLSDYNIYKISDNQCWVDFFFDKGFDFNNLIVGDKPKVNFYVSGNQVFKGTLVSNRVSQNFPENADRFYSKFYSKKVLENINNPTNVIELSKEVNFNINNLDYNTLKQLVENNILKNEAANGILNGLLNYERIIYLKNLNLVDADKLENNAFATLVNKTNSSSTENFITLFPNSKKAIEAKKILTEAKDFENKQEQEKLAAIERKKQYEAEERRLDEVESFDFKVTNWRDGDDFNYSACNVTIYRGNTYKSSHDIMFHYYKDGSTHIAIDETLTLLCCPNEGEVFKYSGETNEAALKRLMKEYIRRKYTDNAKFRF